MNYNTVKLIGKLGSVSKRVLLYGIDGDKQITREFVPFAIVESYDVRKIVVLEVLHIHIQNVIIGTENNGDISQPADFALRH